MMDDRLKAKYVELIVDDTGKLWLNVDGQCVVRIGHVDEVNIDLHKSDTHTMTVAREKGARSSSGETR